MDLQEIRKELDVIDRQIVDLYEKRMKLCGDVAEYKISVGKPVYDGEREKQKLEAVRQMAGEEYRQGASELFTQLMTISEVSELQQAAQSLAQEVDAIYVPIDNTIAQAMPVLAQVGIDFQIPIYTGADSMVQDGGFATVGINYTQLGQKTAEMAAAVLEGTPISELPVETLSEFGTYINQTTAEQIGVEIPQEIAETATILS